MSSASARTRLPAALALAVAGCLMTAAPAGADATATASPAAAGAKATTVSWVVDGLTPPVAGRVPRSLILTARGFRLDPRAVARRCSELQARLDECPRDSKIGTGSLGIIVHRPDRVNDLDFKITLYHGRGSKVLAVTDFIGIRVVPGTLTRSGGLRLTFDPLPTPPVIPGITITYQFKGVSVRLGAKRRLAERARARGSRRYSLVRTPRRCAKSWEATATLGFPDGTSQLLPTPIRCTRR